MRALFVRRSAFEALERFCDTEIWRLRRENRALREREAARTVCVEVMGEKLAFQREERDHLLRDLHDLMTEKVRLDGENRTLRHSYDKMRAELSRVRHDNQELKLMKESLEARLAAPCEVEG